MSSFPIYKNELDFSWWLSNNSPLIIVLLLPILSTCCLKTEFKKYAFDQSSLSKWWNASPFRNRPLDESHGASVQLQTQNHRFYRFEGEEKEGIEGVSLLAENVWGWGEPNFYTN